MEKVEWNLVSYGEPHNVGDVDWRGKIYDEITENFPGQILLVDEEDIFYPIQKWKDVEEPPKKVYEGLRAIDPRQDLIRCPYKPVLKNNPDGNPLAYNRVAKRMVSIEEFREVVMMDSFEIVEPGILDLGRNIVDISDISELHKFSFDAKISYDDEKHGFKEFAESLADKMFPKDMPKVVEVMEYEQQCFSDNPYNVIQELNNKDNQYFLQQELNSNPIY